jgi:hypothetical protein
MHLTFIFIGLLGTFIAIALNFYDKSKSGKNVMNVIFDRQASERNQEELEGDLDSITYDVDEMVEKDFLY